jgi:nucleoside-diphosphate-sugar epimerase
MSRCGVGLRCVIHIASPFPSGAVRDEAGLIRTAREGALRVLQASYQAGVKRAVLTSSTAATNHGIGGAPYSEKDWTDVQSKRATSYYKSKMAERAAGAFSQERRLSLTVIKPGLILGPLIGNDFGSSVGLIWKLMNGSRVTAVRSWMYATSLWPVPGRWSNRPPPGTDLSWAAGCSR